jgi:hypothetical protein
MSRLSRQCGIFNILQPYRPPRPVTGIALLFFLLICMVSREVQSHWKPFQRQEHFQNLTYAGPVRYFRQTKQCLCNIPCNCGRCCITETSTPLGVRIKERKYNMIQGLQNPVSEILCLNKDRSLGNTIFVLIYHRHKLFEIEIKSLDQYESPQLSQ